MNHQNIVTSISDKPHISEPVSGNPLSIGSGFNAKSFKYNQFDNLLDPIVMVDHYRMTSPTFGEHPHAGMSAVSVLFEDSTGIFNNKDSLGNDIDLKPGDAYWLKAGSGAIHDEKPTPGSKTHGLQLFVNLPRNKKFDTPDSLHVKQKDMPIIIGKNARTRIVFGQSNGVKGASSPALPLTILDTYFKDNGSFQHDIEADQSCFIYAVDGDVLVNLGGEKFQLNHQQSIVIQTNLMEKVLTLSSQTQSHVVIIQGKPLRERFVQKGPFVMSTSDELDAVSKAYESGLFNPITHDVA